MLTKISILWALLTKFISFSSRKQFHIPKPIRLLILTKLFLYSIILGLYIFTALICIQYILTHRRNWQFLVVLLNLKLISVNDIVYSPKFAKHFLMMTMTLSCSPWFYLLAHDDINLDAFAIVSRQTEEFLILFQKLDVFSVLHLVPVVKNLLSVPFARQALLRKHARNRGS